MKVCIAGVGRSGTKAIYSLLQTIMTVNHRNVDFIYEPFLWDKDSFNGGFNEVRERFGYMDAISHEGILNHLRLPLFIDNPDIYHENEYLTRLFKTNQGEHKLAKLIRANGRLRLLREICPELKFIFILRNPLDNINSILNRFSFFGGEFHKDDYQRFAYETSNLFPGNLMECNDDSNLFHELVFWYYMNLYALETIRTENLDALCITHEAFSVDTESAVKDICRFLGYDYHSSYCDKAKERVGVNSGQPEIGFSELEQILPFMDQYQGMINEFGLTSYFNPGEIISKYRIRKDMPARGRYGYGFTPIRLARELRTLRERFNGPSVNVESQ